MAVSTTVLPPPSVVFELAERAVEFVRRSLELTLDYTPETLPILDHYLTMVPRDQPDTVELVAAAAGAYFGEVVRRALGGAWDISAPSVKDFRVRLPGDVTMSPIGFCAEAILQSEVEGYDGSFEVPAAARSLVEEALEEKEEVAAEEYYSLSGRLETLMLVVDQVAATRSRAPESPDQ
ncbi:MAG: hypothetical protein HY698_03280 [Deltaproteobacteria bacterium]|nr:hypothetical protein [Deltaproteobacteria bacterium]